LNERGAQDRLLVVFPASTQGKVEAFLRAFRDGLGASFRGFQKGFRDLFGLVRVDFVMCPVSIAVADKAGAEAAYRRAIEARLSSGEEVQGCIVVLFYEHAFLKGLQNPYIRTKALLLTLGIPTQEVHMWTVSQPPGQLQYALQNFSVSVYAKLNGTPWTVSQPPGQLQYALQNFSVSVYAKLNGTPWTVNQDKTISDELVVGIGFAELSGAASRIGNGSSASQPSSAATARICSGTYPRNAATRATRTSSIRLRFLASRPDWHSSPYRPSTGNGSRTPSFAA
jgi:hypothetical protein